MLPDPDDRPARLGESLVGVAVAPSVRLDLLTPELRVVGRPCGVFRAPVPEAPVDHDDDSGPGEDEVGSSANPRKNLAINAIAEAAPVQIPAQLELGLGIARARPSHPVADRNRRGLELIEARTGERPQATRLSCPFIASRCASASQIKSSGIRSVPRRVRDKNPAVARADNSLGSNSRNSSRCGRA